MRSGRSVDPVALFNAALQGARKKYAKSPVEVRRVAEAMAMFRMALRGFHHSLRILSEAEERAAKESESATKLEAVRMHTELTHANNVVLVWAELVERSAGLLSAMQTELRRAKWREEQNDPDF